MNQLLLNEAFCHLLLVKNFLVDQKKVVSINDDEDQGLFTSSNKNTGYSKGTNNALINESITASNESLLKVNETYSYYFR
jgi:hypothetical protein